MFALLRDWLTPLPKGARVLRVPGSVAVYFSVTTTDGRRTGVQGDGKTLREALDKANHVKAYLTAPDYTSPPPTFARDGMGSSFIWQSAPGQTAWTCVECGKVETGTPLLAGYMKPACWYRMQTGPWAFGEGFSCMECGWMHTVAWRERREPPRWMTADQQAAFLVQHPA